MLGLPSSSPLNSASERTATLRSLEVLLELQRQIAEGAHDDRVARLSNPEVRAVLEEILRSAPAEVQLLEEATDALCAEVVEGEDAREPGGEISTRELIEAWIALKETSAEVLAAAAMHVRSRALAYRLRTLSNEEAERAVMLHALL